MYNALVVGALLVLLLFDDSSGHSYPSTFLMLLISFYNCVIFRGLEVQLFVSTDTNKFVLEPKRIDAPLNESHQDHMPLV